MGDRVASLPMYGEIELRPVIEHWWTGVAQYLGEQGLADVPDVLVWPDDIYSHWRSPDLLFSQTCGHPLVNTIAQDVQLVATPHYDVSGCEGPHYASHVLVHAESEFQRIEDLQGCRLAVNGTDSYSGYHVWPPVLPDAERLDTFFGEVPARIARAVAVFGLPRVAARASRCRTPRHILWRGDLGAHSRLQRVAADTCFGEVIQTGAHASGRCIRATTCGRPCFPMPNASTHSLAR